MVMTTRSIAAESAARSPSRLAEAVVRLLMTYLREVGRQMAKFGLVGVMALVVDVGTFNLLMYADVASRSVGEGWLNDKPITAKVISAVLATAFAYAANRWWTFRDRGGSGLIREVALFFLLNGIASFIAVVCLWGSHYGLGLDNATADNLSANVIGLALGTMFRWWSYRRWVFTEPVGERNQVAALDFDPAIDIEPVLALESRPPTQSGPIAQSGPLAAAA